MGMWKYTSLKAMLYVHIPGKGADLKDPADSILKHLHLKNSLKTVKIDNSVTPPDFWGATKILPKKPGPAAKGTGSMALFLSRVLNCSWTFSIFAGFSEDAITGAKEERGEGLLNFRILYNGDNPGTGIPSLPGTDGTFEVVLPLGDIEEERQKGMDCHLLDPPLKRFHLAKCVSLTRGPTDLSSGGSRGDLLKLTGVLLRVLGNMAHGLEDLAPLEACFLFWGT